jgi:hypothetical protein
MRISPQQHSECSADECPFKQYTSASHYNKICSISPDMCELMQYDFFSMVAKKMFLDKVTNYETPDISEVLKVINFQLHEVRKLQTC